MTGEAHGSYLIDSAVRANLVFAQNQGDRAERIAPTPCSAGDLVLGTPYRAGERFPVIIIIKDVKKMSRITIYDTTCRDGTQGEDVNFTVGDKLRIAERLDDLGLDYLEGGWPGSNPRDIEFFRRAREASLAHLKIAAFGATRRAKLSCDEDPSIQSLLKSEAPVLTVFGKTWDLHVTKALGVSLETNVELIGDTVSYLKKRVDEVFFDAEHFFDGWKADPAYALACLEAAREAGADCLVLCDTNGGSLPSEIRRAIRQVAGEVGGTLGIHTHNDAELAVANTLTALEEGALQVQGTMNGVGERCGNANLCSVLPALCLKLGLECRAGGERLPKLREASRFVSELMNRPHDKHLPYVGDSAFAHKGGVHVAAVQKDPATYEHVDPLLVGNRRRVLVSDLSGRSNIFYKARQFGLDIDTKNPATVRILENLKTLEHHGFQYEGAEASFELLMRRAMGTHEKRFKLIGFRVIDEKRREGEDPISEATIMVEVDGVVEHTAAVGQGPVNALDHALRKALVKFYPTLAEVELLDYRVRVLSSGDGTAAVVRVLIFSGDKIDRWGTVGVSHNIIEASYQALVDSVRYKLLKDREKKE